MSKKVSKVTTQQRWNLLKADSISVNKQMVRNVTTSPRGWERPRAPLLETYRSIQQHSVSRIIPCKPPFSREFSLIKFLPLRFIPCY